MRKKRRNVLICTFLSTLLLIIVCCSLLKHEFCAWLSTFVNYNEKINPETELSLLIFNLLVSVIIAIATCIYMVITWNLLVNARKEHKTNLSLTKKIHSDSLTPYLYIEEVECNLIVTKKNNTAICVKSFSDSGNDTITINSLPNVYSINDFILTGTIRLNINNVSKNIAESYVSINNIQDNKSLNNLIQPNVAKSFLFNVDIHLNNTSELQLLLANQKLITIIVSAKGAGLSAEDKFRANFFIKIKKDKTEEAILSKDGWIYEERIREYINIENND